MECESMRRVRNELGLTNVEIMVPFVRTLKECREVIDLLAANGLKRGEGGLRMVMMCEVPSNAVLAEQFLEYFDGFSIGSNDLTQLTLGLDRDSGLVAAAFDERDPAVKVMLRQAIQACRKAGKYVGICGQGPSDHLDFAKWLVEEGIESLSLNPDTVVDTWLQLARETSSKAKAAAGELSARAAAVLLALPLLFALRRALVVLLLPLGEPYRDLHAPADVVQVDRDQRVAGAVDFADEPPNLLRVEQELARAHRVGLDVGGGGGKRADVRADEEDLLARDHHVGFLELRAPGADRLDLPSLEREPGLMALLDEVVVLGLAVLDDRHGAALPIEFSILQR
jgi:hypothetical protein